METQLLCELCPYVLCVPNNGTATTTLSDAGDPWIQQVQIKDFEITLNQLLDLIFGYSSGWILGTQH